MNLGFTQNFTAGAAVSQFRIAIYGDSEGEAVQASAANQRFVGVFSHGAEAGCRVDVVRSNFPQVEYGGVCARGDELTSDAVGRAIKLTDAATQNRIGFAEIDAVSGDIGEMQVLKNKAV